MKQILFWLLLSITATADARPSLLESLGISRQSEEPLAVEEAFRVRAEQTAVDQITLSIDIEPAHYLYQDKLAVQLHAPEGAALGDWTLPAGQEKDDPFFGRTTIYAEDFSLLLPLRAPVHAPELVLEVALQGCSEAFQICYPPALWHVAVAPLQIGTLAPSAPDATSSPAPRQNTEAAGRVDADLQLSQRLANGTFLGIVLSFFGLGLLLTFTPCVLPMIPILSSLIVGQGEQIRPKRAFGLSLTYVLAMSVTYTLAGVLTGLLGGNLQMWLQNPVLIGSFSALLVILALAMFGLFHLALPAALQSRLHALSQRQRGGTWLGAAVMGLLSGLIVGPCLAPPLAGVLLFISQTADPVLGGAALFAMSLGMGVPLLLIGSSAGVLLPKAGDWMVTIKNIFGVLLLALAIWMLDRVVPIAVTLLLWGSLLMILAIYLGALNSLNPEANGWQKLWKGCGFVLLVYGSVLIVGAASGGQSVWKPLAHWATPQTAAATPLPFTLIDSLDALDEALLRSTQPVMLDFYADWCSDCKRMAATTFQDPRVQAELAGFTLLKVDLTDNTPAHQELLRALKVFGPPSFLFFAVGGEEWRAHRLIGHHDAAAFLQHLQQVPIR